MTDPAAAAAAFALSALVTYFMSPVSSLVDRKGTFSFLMLKEESVGFHAQYGRPKGLLFPVNKSEALDG